MKVVASNKHAIVEEIPGSMLLQAWYLKIIIKNKLVYHLSHVTEIFSRTLISSQIAKFLLKAHDHIPASDPS